MRLFFAGSGSAFTIGDNNFQSNMVLESINKHRLLIDCGTDIRLSLFELGWTYKDIEDVLVTHLHADHVGGVELFALYKKFNQNLKKKPSLYISQDIVDDIWNKVLSGGLSTLSGVEPNLETYFEVHAIVDGQIFMWEEAKIEMIRTLHCMNGFVPMSTHGVLISHEDKKVWITSDSQFDFEAKMKLYNEVDLIFHDCETSENPSGVHSHYNQLNSLPESIKKKMWLYHFNPGKLPDAIGDGFKGFVKKGQMFEI